MKIFATISVIVIVLFGVYLYNTKFNRIHVMKQKVDFLFPPSKLEKQIDIG
jgi:hypothetical protein